MKRSTCRRISIALSALMFCNSMPVMASDLKPIIVKPTQSAPVSNRLIVKYKANNLPKGLSVAQIRAHQMQPLSAQTVGQLQSAAGIALSEARATATGAHVLYVSGRPDRQTLNNAIVGISRLPGIEYVEEDKIRTAQYVPNDTYYSTTPLYPALWGMWPVTPVASPAPGGTGSYGADFQTAWDTVSGSGVVVAVIDTGITPNLDIVGPNGTVAAGSGSNLVSAGYDFTSDCRLRGTCAATTADASAGVAPSPNATDRGDFITAVDAATPFFSGCPVSDSSWHGTHVAGTIAALGGNAKGVIGGAFGARILPVRVLGKCGGFAGDIGDGMMWAAGIHPTISNPNPAKVINMSLGGGGACSATEQAVIDAVVGAGTVVVVAAGNSNLDVADFSPASCANVITVAATGRDGSRASYSNFSSPISNTLNPTNVTLAAQGGDQNLGTPNYDPAILSTLNTGTTTPVLSAGTNYAWYQGSSMATPHVAAAAALMLSKNPALTPARIKAILSAPSSLTAFPSFAANTIPTLNGLDCATSLNCGAGILNANRAVRNSAPTVSAPATSDFGSVFINGVVTRTVALTNPWLVSAQVGVVKVSGAGAAMFTIGTNTCSNTAIAPSGTCRITLSYAPLIAGAHVATLTIPISGAVSGASSPALISLTGSAGSAALTTSTPNVTATTVSIGQSVTVNISYTNPNAIALKTGAIILSRPEIMAVSADACSNVVLAAGASCVAKVTISPANGGGYSGTASLALSGSSTHAVVTISGSVSSEGTYARAIISFQSPTSDNPQLNTAIAGACHCQPTFLRSLRGNRLIYSIALPSGLSFVAFAEALMLNASQFGISAVEQDQLNTMPIVIGPVRPI